MLGLIRSDGRLVREALRGASPALEEIVRRYQRKAHSVARAHLPREADPEDAVQEAFCQALRDLPRLREGESFGPWFLSIVRNVARKESRRIGRFDPLEVDPVDPRPAGGLEWSDLRAGLWREVHRLPPLLREAVLIYYHEGNCVRAVARAQGISTALARKRLQLGRDRLREELWRKLGNEIRDLMPSARSWRRKARKATLLLLIASPRLDTAAASAPAAATNLIVQTLGVFAMANKSFIVTLLILTLVGASFWLGNAWAPAADGGPIHARVIELKAQAEKSAILLKKLEKENEELRRKVAILPAQGADPGIPAALAAPDAVPDALATAPDVGPASLDCSVLAGLLVQNVDLLPGGTKGTKDSLSPEEEARMLEMHAELMKLRGRAKVIGPHAFFRPEIFDELTGALFGGPLDLSSEQMEKLREINRSIFAALPEHPEEASRLDQFRLREDMLRQLWDGVEGLLDDEQKERWKPVRSFSEMAFAHGGEFNYGVENAPEVLESNLRHLYSLEKPQLEVARPFAEALLGDARQILARYGQSESEIDQLPAADKLKLEDEFLDLQSRFEGQLDGILSADQKKALFGMEFSLLRFTYGKGIFPHDLSKGG
jgi:RNA polymerase sigma-70 factor (ECF subfamily)